MLTRKMLHFDMPSEFFAAISIKVTVRTLQNTTGYLDATLSVFSLSHSRQAKI